MQLDVMIIDGMGHTGEVGSVHDPYIYSSQDYPHCSFSWQIVEQCFISDNFLRNLEFFSLLHNTVQELSHTGKPFNVRDLGHVNKMLIRGIIASFQFRKSGKCGQIYLQVSLLI